MSHFANSLRVPRSLTDDEVQRLLKESGRYEEDFTGHMVIALALGMALRVHEIEALNVGDVFDEHGTVRQRWLLRVFKGCRRPGAKPQEVFVAKGLFLKLGKLYELKKRRGHSLEPDAPLFVSRKRTRMSSRHMRRLLKHWLAKAGLDTSLTFHELRHSALTQLMRRNEHPEKIRAIARHSDIRTTQRYMHVCAQELVRALERQVC